MKDVASQVLRGIGSDDSVFLLKPNHSGKTPPVPPEVDAPGVSSDALASRTASSEAPRSYELGYRAGIDHAERTMRHVIRQELEGEFATRLQSQRVDARLEAEREVGLHKERLTQQCQLIEQIAQQLVLCQRKVVDQAEDDVITMVHDIVCQIIGDHAATIGHVRRMVKKHLPPLRGQSVLSLHVHPDDLSLLQEDARTRETLSAAGFSQEQGSLRWVSDPEVKLGGFILRSASGSIDARLESQIDDLTQRLIEVRRIRLVRAPAAKAQGGDAK